LVTFHEAGKEGFRNALGRNGQLGHRIPSGKVDFTVLAGEPFVEGWRHK